MSKPEVQLMSQDYFIWMTDSPDIRLSSLIFGSFFQFPSDTDFLKLKFGGKFKQPKSKN